MKPQIRLMFICTLTILFFALLSPMLNEGVETLGTLCVRWTFSVILGIMATYLFNTMAKRAN